MKLQNRYIRLTCYVLAGLLFFQVLGSYTRKHFYKNLSVSEPIGLYRLQPFTGELQRGELVLMSTPKEFEKYVYGREWLPRGWPLLKHVGALAGDSFCISGPNFSIEGKEIGRVFSTDSKGLPLPKLSGCVRVPVGSFLPIATHDPLSFDGRYMGPVSLSHVLAKAKPLLTF